ncbi:MAG: cupin domain-containing protein [Rubrobacter sp.]|nr:cupin domain-containing protein [Rubrobacter sp.]
MASGARNGGKTDISKVNVREQLALREEHRSSKVVDGSRGRRVRPVEFSGEFVRPHHEAEDEMSLVVWGSFRDRGVVVEEGEILPVSRGVEHRFVTEEEVRELLLEPVFAVGAGSESIVEPERI